MFLESRGERLDRDPRRPGQHQGRAGGELTRRRPSGRNRRHAIDTGATGGDLKFNPQLIVDAFALGHDLTQDSVAGQPSELHADLGPACSGRGNANERRCRRHSAQGCAVLQDPASAYAIARPSNQVLSHHMISLF